MTQGEAWNHRGTREELEADLSARGRSVILPDRGRAAQGATIFGDVIGSAELSSHGRLANCCTDDDASFINLGHEKDAP